jgi:hypothetical protein
MNTLWTFGDSFTEGHGCLMEDEYYKNYWKSGDKIWPVRLSELLDVNLINCGIGGYSNDMIFDSIIDNWLQIKKNDYVFIGFTYPHRFDVPIDNKLKSIVHDFKDANLKKEEIETVINFQHYFSDNILYKNRQYKRLNWVKELLISKGCKLVALWDVQIDIKNLETITGATNRDIIDGHLSYNSHNILATQFYKKYIKKDLL